MTEPLVQITLKEIYDKVVDLNSKISVLLSTEPQRDATVADHENRLRTLERSRWPLPSIAALISLAAFIISVVRPWGDS